MILSFFRERVSKNTPLSFVVKLFFSLDHGRFLEIV